MHHNKNNANDFEQEYKTNWSTLNGWKHAQRKEIYNNEMVKWNGKKKYNKINNDNDSEKQGNPN